jgi:hypothetical protein
MLLSSSEDTVQNYRDIDYDSFLDADFDSDVHWTLLPKAERAAQEKAREAALEQERMANQPSNHQVILVPAESTYAPKEEELWPIINHSIQSALKPFPEAHRAVMIAVHHGLDDYRGWRNPYPVSLAYPDRPVLKETGLVT